MSGTTQVRNTVPNERYNGTEIAILSVGEQRRILNTFLQLLERDSSDSFIIAATNSVESIDKALFRRFDDVIEFKLPDQIQRLKMIKESLYTAENLDVAMVEPLFDGMSHAEIKLMCSDIFKESLLNNIPITEDLVESVINMRRNSRGIV